MAGLLTRSIVFLLLALLGVAPAALVALRGASAPAPWPPIDAEARVLAAALDSRAAVWFEHTERLADQVSGLLARLPTNTGKLGTAAEGTLMLHLQGQLAKAPEMGEYALVNAAGRIIISTDGTRATGEPAAGLPELAQAAGRPALALAPSASSKTAVLLVAAPIRSGDTLQGMLVAWPRPERVRALLRPEGGTLRAWLVDANGRLLGAAPPTRRAALRQLGTESDAGRARVDGKPAVYRPLSTARATIVVQGSQPPRPAPWRPWHGALLAAILALAGLGAWAWGR